MNEIKEQQSIRIFDEGDSPVPAEEMVRRISDASKAFKNPVVAIEGGASGYIWVDFLVVKEKQ